MTTYTPPVTREQFELVRPMVEQHRRQTRPRLHDLYDILCLVLYREQEGLAWRDLPRDVPWRTVHEYHRNWTMPARSGELPLLDRVKHALNKEKP
jgi:transposase